MRFLAFSLVLVLTGCSDPEPSSRTNTADASIPFDIEGELSFVRGSDTLRTIAIEIADDDSNSRAGPHAAL